MAWIPIGKFLSPLLNKQAKWNQWIGIMIEYKGYIGHFFFDEKKMMFFGRVANSNDFITFQGKSVSEIKHAFYDSVEEYIVWCKRFRQEKAQTP